jgi:excinuclease UvrABC ATPase subunit
VLRHGLLLVGVAAEGKLRAHLGGRDISGVLEMSVTEAEEFFDTGEARTPTAHKILDRLADVGFGHLSLGPPPTTLFGGERQQLTLATHIKAPALRSRPRT